jgi:hypothetical protein
VTCYHGTTLACIPGITRNGSGPWVTPNADHARTYAAFAVWRLHGTALFSPVPPAAAGLILTLRVDPDALVADPDAEEFQLPGGAPPSRVVSYEAVDVRDRITAYAGRAQLAALLGIW